MHTKLLEVRALKTLHRYFNNSDFILSFKNILNEKLLYVCKINDEQVRQTNKQIYTVDLNISNRGHSE